MPKYRLIFLPGMLGSALQQVRSNQPPRTVWNGDIGRLCRLLLHEPLLLHPFTTLEPTDVIRRLSVWGVPRENVYGELLEFLQRVLGYDQRSLHLFHFDWRQSVLETAGQLTRFIADTSAPQDEVVLLGHSMGGVIARTAVMLAQEQRVGTGIKKVITLGSPQLGASTALRDLFEFDVLRSLNAFVGTFAQPLVSTVAWRLSALARAMPAAWELLSPPVDPILMPPSPANPGVPALE